MIYTKNIDFLKKNVNYLYCQIQDIDPDRENYKVEQARMVNVPTIEKLIKGRMNPIHSRFNPLNEATKWAEGTNTQESKDITDIILFGFGFGYHFAELSKIHPKAKFYIFEPDENIVFHALEAVDWTIFPWKRVVEFGVGRNSENVDLFISKFLAKTNHDCLFCSLPSYQKIYKKEHEEFQISFHSQKEGYIGNLKTTAFFEKKWTLNALKNLETLVNTPSIYRYKKYFCNQTVIMTASGPSLEEAIPLISYVNKEGKGLVIAAGTSVRALDHLGVRPDMFVSYDPTTNNFRALESILAKDIPLVFGSTLSYEVVEKHKGDKAHFITSQDTVYPFLDKAYDQSQLISDAPTVAAVTLQLLIKLGVKQIILAGQDLAYIENKFYAPGTSTLRSEILTEEEKESWLEVDNNIGSKSYTSNSFLKMKDSIEQVVAAYPGVKIYNLSQKGAKIKGVQFITENEAREMLQQQEAMNFDLNIEDFAENPTILRDYFKILKKAVKFYTEQTHRIEDLLKQMDLASKEGKSLKLFFQAIDNHVNKMTNKNDFNYFIRPFVRTRIFFAEKNINKIRNATNPNQDIYEEKEVELANYYIKEIGALIVELKEVINIYENLII